MSLEWQAVYKDGTALHQYNEDRTENSYVAIDRTNLAEFRLYNGSGEIIFCQVLDPEHRLIYRRRVYKHISGEEQVIYLVGWQMTVQGQNVQSICYIKEDGSIIIAAGKFRDDSRIFYSIVPIDCEITDDRREERLCT